MTPVVIGDATLHLGDVLACLREMPAESVHCIVTSPPYWGLRDYGIEPTVWDGDPGCVHEWGGGHAWKRSGGSAHSTLGEYDNGLTQEAIDAKVERQTMASAPSSFCAKCGAWLGSHGLEPTPELYVQHEVLIFREVRRVLRSDGTLWLNLGDSYIGGGRGGLKGCGKGSFEESRYQSGQRIGKPTGRIDGYKAKDLVGIPWMTAFALRADGWYLRSGCPWIKRNPMPESCTDRPATSLEHVFLLTKSPKYFYDRKAVQLPAAGTAHARGDGVNPKAKVPSGWDQENHGRAGMGRFRPKQNESFSGAVNKVVPTRNRRNSDWFMESWQGLLCDDDGEPLAFVVNTKGYKGAHFATFPPKLVRPMILAGCPEGGTVLDPFLGSGTTLAVALEYGRRGIGIERKPEYVEMARKRITPVAGRPLLAFEEAQ